jgi:hypothetical protein
MATERGFVERLQRKRHRPEQVLRNYFHAKDENRPHLLDAVFAPDAQLEVANRASAIVFPAVTLGREAIADVLVRDFGRTYEDVYSFYCGRPADDVASFACAWLVVMSDKASRVPRVGCGRYEWTFATDASGLASRLRITIEAMQLLAPADAEAVARWRQHLPYPWATTAAVLASAPPLAGLAPVLEVLAQ